MIDVIEDVRNEFKVKLTDNFEKNGGKYENYKFKRCKFSFWW